MPRVRVKFLLTRLATTFGVHITRAGLFVA